LTHSGKLSRKLLGSFNRFRTTFRALMKTLKSLEESSLELGRDSADAEVAAVIWFTIICPHP
jgi:hypothetical protein